MSTDQQRTKFGLLLRRAREDCGRSQVDVGEAVGRTRGAVWQWEAGESAPDAVTVAKLEQFLELRAGELAAVLGYVDLSNVEPSSADVLEAVRADPRLGDIEREVLSDVYRTLVRRRAASKKTVPPASD